MAGFVGILSISVLKRDLLIGNTAKQKQLQGRYLSRIDSLTYTSPVFFSYHSLLFLTLCKKLYQPFDADTIFPYEKPGVKRYYLTTNTGQWALFVTLLLTLPIIIFLILPRPRLPITIKSTFMLFAKSQISFAGLP